MGRPCASSSDKTMHRAVQKIKKKTKQYSPSKMALAIRACNSGTLLRTAATMYDVPRSTLRNKVKGISPEIASHPGFDSCLGEETEEKLEEWVLNNSKMGFPITKDQLLDSVAELVRKARIENKFNSDTQRPGKTWFYNFLKRHKRISQKHAEYIHAGRGAFTKSKIQCWFDSVVENLKEEERAALKDPKRVFNLDETYFNLVPKSPLILGERGVPTLAKHGATDKENVTTLLCVNALGNLAPPMTIYKYERYPANLYEKSPKHWVFGKSDSGWMNSSCFYTYMVNNFNNFLFNENITKPVIVFMDGHKSHLTLHLAEFCQANGIVLVALLPNATHFLQPLDVGVFSPLKQSWKKVVHQWRMDHEGHDITKTDIPALLHKILKDPRFENNCKSAFKATGLHPFDSNALKYNEIIKNKTETCRKQMKEDNKHLTYIEDKIPPEILTEFTDTLKRNIQWEGKEEARMLFEVWKKCKEDIANENLRIRELIQDAADYESGEDVRNIAENNNRRMNEIIHIAEVHAIEEVVDVIQDIHGSKEDAVMIERVTTSLEERINEELEDDPPEPQANEENGPNKSNPPLTERSKTPVSSKLLKDVREQNTKQLSEIFDSVLRYPGDCIKKGRKRKEVVNCPPVLTCEQVMEYQKKKEYQKLELENLRAEKKKEREAKKTKIAQKRKKNKSYEITTFEKKCNEIKCESQRKSDLSNWIDVEKKKMTNNKEVEDAVKTIEKEMRKEDEDCPEETDEYCIFPGTKQSISTQDKRGLCYQCGKNIAIHEYCVPCMICNIRISHQKCIEKELDDQEDPNDLIYVCKPCFDNISDSE